MNLQTFKIQAKICTNDGLTRRTGTHNVKKEYNIFTKTKLNVITRSYTTSQNHLLTHKAYHNINLVIAHHPTRA